MPTTVARARAVIIGGTALALGAAGLAFASTASAAPTMAAAPATAHVSPAVSWKRACPTIKTTGMAACMALINTHVAQRASMAIRPDATAPDQ